MRRVTGYLLALLLVFAGQAHAQLALIGAGKALASAGGGGGGGTPPTFQLANGIGSLNPGTTVSTSSWNPGAVGNFLLVLGHASEYFGLPTTIDSATHGAQGMTAVLAEVESTMGQGRVFSLASPSNSSVATSVTVSTGIQNEGVIALAYSGATGTCGTVSGTSDTADPIDIDVPTANAEDIAVAFVWGFTIDGTPGAIGFTLGTGVSQRRLDYVDAFGSQIAVGAGFDRSRNGTTTRITVTPTGWTDNRLGYIGVCLRGNP